MNLRRIALLVLVAVALVAGALAAGVGPFGGDDGRIDDFPTATPGGGDGGAEQPPFDLRIEEVDECGQTCRDVTATLINQQDRRATGVTVFTRIHAGNGTDGDVVWEGSREVGAIDAGGSVTETQRVELSFAEAFAIEREDGWVTMVVTIQTDRQTVTFEERQDVA